MFLLIILALSAGAPSTPDSPLMLDFASEQAAVTEQFAQDILTPGSPATGQPNGASFAVAVPDDFLDCNLDTNSANSLCAIGY